MDGVGRRQRRAAVNYNKTYDLESDDDERLVATVRPVDVFKHPTIEVCLLSMCFFDVRIMLCVCVGVTV